MHISQLSLLLATSLGYIGFVIVASISATQGTNDGRPFYSNIEVFAQILGYSFLLMFILMASANALLVAEISKAAKFRENGGTAAVSALSSIKHQQTFRREYCTLAAILLVFALSYLLRFLWDVFLNGLVVEQW